MESFVDGSIFNETGVVLRAGTAAAEAAAVLQGKFGLQKARLDTDVCRKTLEDLYLTVTREM